MQSSTRRISSNWIHLARALRPGAYFLDHRRDYTQPRKKASLRFHRTGKALPNNFKAKQARSLRFA